MELGLFRKLYQLELEKLRNEINLYEDEYALWIVDKEITNSAGNLCLHLIGNLKHFIGVGLGEIDYIRNRELEFISDDVPREILVEGINETIAILDATLKTISTETLKNEYPISKFEEPTSIEFALIHLLTHLSYHIGQINYHRRLFDN